MPKDEKRYPTTPDGRYFVVRGRLWRCSDPKLDSEVRAEWVRKLMRARRDVGVGRRAQDEAAVKEARVRVQEAKVALGERGAPWWTNGAPDFNRRMAANTPYAEWFAALAED